jgi:acetyl-CoA carboxylase carboxyl transferase subunit alpha
MGIVDDVIPEPLGGAHRDHHKMAATMRSYLGKQLKDLKQQEMSTLLDGRYEKFRRIGEFVESETVS